MDSCEIWVGTQMQTMDRNAAAALTGLPEDKVQLHTTYLGGGFGRRAVPDSHFVKEAVQVSMAVKAPVKIIWTREDDIKGGYYRPRFYHKLNGGLDKDGRFIALYGKITLKNGRVEQSNFYDYEMLRIDETPEIEVHIAKSDEAVGGVGEPGVPPIAPAVANAVFAATGVRLRELPFKTELLVKG